MALEDHTQLLTFELFCDRITKTPRKLTLSIFDVKRIWNPHKITLTIITGNLIYVECFCLGQSTACSSNNSTHGFYKLRTWPCWVHLPWWDMDQTTLLKFQRSGSKMKRPLNAPKDYRIMIHFKRTCPFDSHGCSIVNL